METILTKVQDGVIILDTENKIVFVNQGAREALSLDGKELTAKPAIPNLQNAQIIDLLQRGGDRAEINLEARPGDGRSGFTDCQCWNCHHAA